MFNVDIKLRITRAIPAVIHRDVMYAGNASLHGYNLVEYCRSKCRGAFACRPFGAVLGNCLYGPPQFCKDIISSRINCALISALIVETLFSPGPNEMCHVSLISCTASKAKQILRLKHVGLTELSSCLFCNRFTPTAC